MKRRLVISEGERSKILNMHGFKQMLSEATLVDVQKILNDKFGAGLTPDGKLGPKTVAAIEKALGGSPAAPTNNKPEEITKLTPKPLTQIPTNVSTELAGRGESSSAGV